MMYQDIRDLRDLPRKALHHTDIGMPLVDSHNPIHQICSVTDRERDSLHLFQLSQGSSDM